jgi:hypothetical protein
VDLKILNSTKYIKNKMGSHNFRENKLKGITKLWDKKLGDWLEMDE